jgi:hypothetical protein
MVRVMTSSPSQLRTWSSRPLTPAEWAEAERVAQRLTTELRRLIDALPEHARHASGMSRHLNVLRATCQRVVQAVQEEPGSPSMLAKLPGVEGMRQFLDGFRLTEVDGADVEAAQSAIEGFERLITTMGGSQAKLIDRLSVSPSSRVAGAAGASSTPALATPEQRAALFHAAAAVTGRKCEISLSIYAFRIDPQSPATMQRALAKGMFGSTVAPGGVPMILTSGDTLKGDDEVRRIMQLNREAMRGRTPEAILRPFSTDPLPMVTSRNRRGALYQVIDPAAAAARIEGQGGDGAVGDSPADQKLDVTTALLASHPMYDPQTGLPTLNAVWSLASCPTEKLIFDVYLHSDMERLFRPSIDALLWQASLDIPDDDKWVMRLPNQPRLQLLGRGLTHSASDLYPRHAELTKYFFDHIEWDPEDFVGFRCEVVYPIWRAGYCMGMEYLGHPHKG